MFSCILFDLDGTISDPKQGICGCVQYALRSFGIEEPELDRLEPFIGPPLAESFMKYYNFTAEQAQEAVEKYRERFSVTGKYENVLYPGMGALLHDLKASGATLGDCIEQTDRLCGGYSGAFRNPGIFRHRGRKRAGRKKSAQRRSGCRGAVPACSAGRKRSG